MIEHHHHPRQASLEPSTNHPNNMEYRLNKSHSWSLLVHTNSKRFSGVAAPE